ncbi:MAG: hypothetical protein JW822_04235 [Spirochaetales bacterium]|nr:hypothetical protein [Spirochaetales bacterium]
MIATIAAIPNPAIKAEILNDNCIIFLNRLNKDKNKHRIIAGQIKAYLINHTLCLFIGTIHISNIPKTATKITLSKRATRITPKELT